jgi:hypothetical protein
MTRDEDTALRTFLDEMVAKGYIHPSKSPYASPFFFVKKKDRKLQLVQEYRWLNSHTVRNQYPLPLITQLISNLGRAYLSPNWTYGRDTTMYESKRGMNGRPLSKLNLVTGNHW